MKKISQLVQYDFQKNTFYKINKETGQSQNTYRNGQKLKNFRPNITGQSYLLRRNAQKIDSSDHKDQKSKIFKQKSTNHNKSYQDNPIYKFMNHTKRQNKLGETTSIIMKQTLYNNHTQQVRKSMDKSRKGSITMNTSDLESELSKEKSDENLKKLQLNKTLRSYYKLTKQKSKQRKSPRKDIPGYEQTRDPMQTLCTTLSTFRRKQYILDQKLPRKSYTIELGQQYSPRKNFLYQRNLFLNCNPEYQIKDDPKKIKIQIQRKRNLKILQDLFIRQNNKKTRSIYSFYK